MSHMRALMEAVGELFSNTVPAWRGVPPGAPDNVDTTYGAFFADREHTARGYAGDGGRVIAVRLDLSAALDWTHETAKEFQEYVISCRRDGRSPQGVLTALRKFNRNYDEDLTLAGAIGELLKCRPQRLAWQELDPLLGYQRGFIKRRGADVIVRPHESGSGMFSGNEYIVFSPKRILPPELASGNPA